MSSDNNTAVIREMKKIIDEGKPLDIETRDRLLFSAVIDIYEKLELLQPALTFYKVGLWFASALGLAVLGLIGGILTGRVEIIFK